MSLLTEASLIVTPNAYKAGTLYSVIPNTTLGDMDVSRGSSATRVNEQGLIEIARTNQISYSEEFDNASWNGVNRIITANVTTAPDNTMTADKFIPDNTNGAHNIHRTGLASDAYTFSVFAKAGEETTFSMWLRTASFGAVFDLSTGTITSNSASIIPKIEPYPNGWYRCSVYDATPGTTAHIYGRSGGGFIGNNVNGFFIWGAQAEAGSVATEYIPTTTVARTKFAGITQDGLLASNIPRIDYPPLGGCPSILVEPARTNSLLYSEQFDNASWGKTNATVTANTITAPDGTSTADTINLSAGTAPRVTQNYLIANSTTYTLSCFFKNIALTAGQTFDLRYNNQVGSPNNFEMIATIDLAAGTATYSFAGTLVTGYSGTVTGVVEPYPNGWYRISVTLTTGTGATNNGQIQIIHASQARSFYAWGAQLEAGSTATSYIPTVAAPVPRDADVISKTGISSLIGQTEGTLYFEVQGFSDGNTVTQFITLNDGTTNNQIGFNYTQTLGRISGYFRINGATLSITSTVLKTLNSKIILKYNSSYVYTLFINGSLIGTVNALNPFLLPLTTFKASAGDGGFPYNGNIKSIVLWKTPLTDDQCILLTGPSFSSYPEMASALIYTLQ